MRQKLYGLFIDEELVYVDTIEDNEEAYRKKWEEYIKYFDKHSEWLLRKKEVQMRTLPVPSNISEETAKEVFLSAFNPIGQWSRERQEEIDQGWLGALCPKAI